MLADLVAHHGRACDVLLLVWPCGAMLRRVQGIRWCKEGCGMPIQRLLEGSGLGHKDVERLNRAYRDALHAMHLVDRNDPVTEMVARKIIEIGKNGGDPAEIAKMAMKELGIRG